MSFKGAVYRGRVKAHKYGIGGLAVKQTYFKNIV